MSKVQLQGNASGTGIFTIASPNSNTDRTLTLPNSSGTLLNNASTAGFPAGSVLQVVQTVTSSSTSNSTATYVTAISASITPTSSSSKILVLVSATISVNVGNNTGVGIQLARGATVLTTNPYNVYDSNTGGGQRINMESVIYLDSPATTSSTTYNFQINSAQVGVTGHCSQYGPSTITLMEIAA